MTYLAMVKLLGLHGLTPRELTLYDPSTKTMVDGSSFLDTFGSQAEYSAKKVLAWLGY